MVPICSKKGVFYCSSPPVFRGFLHFFDTFRALFTCIWVDFLLEWVFWLFCPKPAGQNIDFFTFWADRRLDWRFGGPPPRGGVIFRRFPVTSVNSGFYRGGVPPNWPDWRVWGSFLPLFRGGPPPGGSFLAGFRFFALFESFCPGSIDFWGFYR